MTISLTSVCSKVMVHVIYHSIMSHLNRNNVLSGNQHSGYSCFTQLISLIEDLNFHMDHNTQVDMILLDFSKAIDTVPHCCLLKKLKFITLRIKLFNELKNGLQYVNNMFYLMENHLTMSLCHLVCLRA